MFHNIKSYLFSIIVFMVSITSSFGVMITYDLNGGHLLDSNETTYQIDTDINPALSEKPILEDYAFVGWCSKSSRCSYKDFITTIGISSLTDDTTLYAIYVPNISISCDDGQYAEFDVSRYWNNASARCLNCQPGSYCVAGTYSLLDIDPDSYPEYGYPRVGVQPCSGLKEYSDVGQSSCSICAAEDMAANPAHDGCVCWNDDNNDGVNDGDYIMEIDGSWDYNKSQCYRRDSIQCDIKNYAELLQYDNNTNRYEWFRCSGCKAGYYCPGGTYNYADKIRVWHPGHIEQYQAYLNGEQDYYGFEWGVGAYQCSGNQISDWYQSSCDISCPDNSSPNLLHAACVCNSGYIFNLSTNECVSRDVMVCPSEDNGEQIYGHEAYLESYNSETNQYDAFSCVGCHGGYYCDGTVFEYDESKIHDGNYLGGKACTGDTYTGYNDSATSCKQCPNGLSATDNHMMCQCPDGTYWNVDDGNCGTSCPAGTYADFDYYSSAHGEPAYECWRCEPGYYCDGTNSFGGSNLTPEDNGLKSCGDGKYSAYNSTSISDCGVCEKNADAFTTGESDGKGGCVCEDGFRWDNDRAICIVSGCPSWENFPGFAPYGENGGMLMAIDHFGYTYTDSQGNVQNECVMPWLVFESPIASEEDMMNAIENGETYMMLCKHKRINNDNPYIGPCTKAGKVSLNELMEMFENIDAFLPWIMDKMHESNPENIFTTTTDIDVEGTNEGAVVFATEGVNCTTATVLGAQMCLIDGLPGENVNALIARKNGQIYHMLLSNTEHTITSNSSHVLKIIAASGTWYAHDESVE